MCRFGYLSWLEARIWSNLTMLGLAQSPVVLIVLTLTHSTGAPSTAVIMRSMRSCSVWVLPWAMSAASVVPRASTQQPLSPPALMWRATSSALSWPLRCSTIDRAPDTWLSVLVTPTRAYLASIRSAGLGRYEGENGSIEVESPR